MRSGFDCHVFQYKLIPVRAGEFGNDVYSLSLDELAGIEFAKLELREALEYAKAWSRKNLRPDAQSKHIFNGKRRRRLNVFFGGLH